MFGEGVAAGLGQFGLPGEGCENKERRRILTRFWYCFSLSLCSLRLYGAARGGGGGESQWGFQREYTMRKGQEPTRGWSDLAL